VIHINHIISNFNAKTMSGRRTYATLVALRREGYQVSLIVGKDFQPAPDWNLAGIQIFHLPDLVKNIAPDQDIKALHGLTEILRRHRPQVIHTHLAKAGVLGRLAARLAGVPLIMHTVHGPTFPPVLPKAKQLAFKSMEKICSRVTDHFIFVGEELRQDYINAGICRNGLTSVIRTGRPQEEFAAVDAIPASQLAAIRRSITAAPEAFLIGVVSRLAPMKRLEEAIQILHLLRQQGIPAHLAIAGAPDPPEETHYRDALRQLTASLELAPYVHFIGFREDILPFMKAMDALLLTSSYEGLPNVVVEAGIVGRPIVVYEVCGLRELIVDGETGYVVPQGDRHGATAKLKYLAQNPIFCSDMGHKASQVMRQKFNLEKMLAEKIKLYREFLTTKGFLTC